MIDRSARGASARPDAEILAWPDQESRRRQLAADGIPRLLVLERGTAPPPDLDRLEDCIWTPADERDVFARLRHIALRSARSRLEASDLSLAGGLLVIGGRRLRLPPVEAAILRQLGDPPETLHTREELVVAAWGDDAHERRSLDSRILALRRRLDPVGLEIRAVRGRGFVLTVRAQEAS